MKRALVLLGVLVVAFNSALPARASVVCFKQGARDVCFTPVEPAPKSPRTTEGMKATLSKTVLVGDDSTKMTASGFVPGEYVRAFVFNIFGQKSATELSGGAQANGAGKASVTYGTFSLISVSETRTFCLRGERSLRMACLPFTYEG